MWPYYPELLARPVPRYTSYPTAAEFTDQIGNREYEAALAALPEGTGISFYVHIPFCKEICFYCGCNTGRANRNDRVMTYVEALEAEISTLSARVGGRLRIDRLAFGGGSPNALDPITFVRLTDHILTSFAAAAPEISIELDPRTLSPGWADILGRIGATRASLGVQTFAPHVQEAIGRIQPHAMIVESVQELRANGISSLNFDLMYGLPRQTAADVEETIAQALDLAPDRVALFGYAHMPHLVKRQRQINDEDLPGQPERFAMAQAGYRQLVNAGMDAIGFDHFALPADPLAVTAQAGKLRRNFQGFTDDPAEVLLGVGASAISQLPGLIVQNEKNNGRYRMRSIAGLLPTACGVERDEDDRLRGVIIEDLLCGRTADLHGIRFDGERLRPFVDAGMCILSGPTLKIAHNGLPYARAIAACFDRHRAQQPNRFSNAI